MRRKVKFLTVVWGESYVERFATLALPSFLAPGNLPALAAATELEVVVMTARRDIQGFDRHDAFRRLRAVCPVRFIEIDDLIAGTLYGITLTLAYARALIACGPEMLQTHFVFMNADFVLANGSLQGLARHILQGRAIVLGPSFRASAEAIEPRLRGAVDAASGALVMQPRQLVALALAHPHPTTAAKLVAQAQTHSVRPNQFFWRVDEDTWLGRYYLIFMLCIRPERLVTDVNSFCDYGFIPEMCPSGDEAVMGDSDEFFMLELQQRDQESALLRLGSQSDGQIARSLTQWTTAAQRRGARHDVIFHAADIPPAIEAAKVEARAFHDRINRLLGPPLQHAFHPYWLQGIVEFRSLRAARGLPASPAELAPPPTASLQRSYLRYLARRTVLWLKAQLLAALRIMWGRPPRVGLLHPDWLDYMHLRKALDTILAEPAVSLLVVREDAALVDGLISRDAPVRFATPHEMLRAGAAPPPAPSHCLIILPRVIAGQGRELALRCREIVGAHGALTVFVQHSRAGSPGAIGSPLEVAREFDGIGGDAASAIAASFAGGRLKQLMRGLFSRLAGQFEQLGPVAALWIVPVLVLGAPAMLAVNCFLRLSQPSRRAVTPCSSVLIRVFSQNQRNPTSRARPRT